MEAQAADENLDIEVDDVPDDAGLSPFEKLDVGTQAKVRSVLYIVDKYGVSAEAYRELSMISTDLPRYYLLDSCKKFLASDLAITRIDGVHGNEINLLAALSRDEQVVNAKEAIKVLNFRLYKSKYIIVVSTRLQYVGSLLHVIKIMKVTTNTCNKTLAISISYFIHLKFVHKVLLFDLCKPKVKSC